MPTESLVCSPPTLPGQLQRADNAPLPSIPKDGSAASVVYFSPVELSAQDRLTSELLRFL